MLKRSLIVTAAIAGLTGGAAAQDTYNVGLTGALTGPAAGTYAPAVDGLRIYIDKVNAAGGVNGKKINLILLDDSAQPARAAANATRLVTDDKVVLLLNASLSSTYAPVVAESQKANIPLIFASSVCPKDVYPPANALQFCTTAFAATYDSRAVLDFVKATAKEPVKLGLSAMAIPISRGEIDFAEELSKTLGMTPVSKQIIPPPTPDYTPFATLIKDAGANWAYSWAPWVTQVRTLEGLRRLGWTGDYVAWAHLEAENELARLKDGKFYVVGANALFQDNLPIHKEITDAAKAAKSQYPVNQMAEGWIAGMVIEAALKSAGWPANAEKVTASLSNLKVDLKGLRGGELQWTKDNHFRTKQYYRVYRWDETKGAIVQVRDWQAFDVK
ncbi:MAG TPA: ABC transporter substrate-binding protein [Xanthobacteraceae bacterium]|nr:ABC transporter substrate-binding protein [Xanthobacteraceae bacterium]